jgi:hypothetical protein
MKYELYTYCKTDAEYSIDVWTAKRLNITPGGINVKHFENKDALFAYVRGYDYIKSDGTQSNRFLEAVMTNPKDSQRHRIGLSDAMRKNVFGVNIGYLVKDEKGRILDLRNYADEVYKFDIAKYNKDIREKNRTAWEKQWVEREALWDKKQKLYEGKPYWGYYRNIRTTQERRYNCIKEYKAYIRSRRSFSNLPHAWDDLYFHREKTWKARTKVKKQWLVNKKRHIDTVNKK